MAGPLQGIVCVVDVLSRLVHADVGPAAVPAQHGDGVGSAQLALAVGHGLGIDEALDVEAIDKALGLHLGSSLVGDGNGDGDGGGAAGGHGDTVAGGEGHIGGQLHHLVGGQSMAVDLGNAGGHHLRGQSVGLLGIGQVIQGEGEAALSGAVTQLGLDLAVALAVHQNVGVRQDHVLDAGQTRALVPDGVGQLVLHEHLGGGHQQGLGQNALAQTGLFDQTLVRDVLAGQRRQARHMGRGHGGAGHLLVSLAGGIHTVDGVDIAAGGGDLRLQLQIAGGAPAGEVGHGDLRILGAVVDVQLVLHGEGAIAAAEQLVNLLGLLQGDGGAGDGGGAALNGGIDGIGNVVVDDDGGSTGQRAVCVLVGEGDTVAAGHQDDLALHIDEILHLAAVDIQVGLLLTIQKGGGITDEDTVEGHTLAQGVQGDPGLVDVACHTLHPELGSAEGGLQIGHEAHIVGGGDAEGTRIGGGLGGGIRTALVGVHHAVGHVVVGPVAGVTGGGAHDDAGLGQPLHQAVDVLAVAELILMGGGEAGVRAAQGQIDTGAAQDHGILGGGHVVGGVRAAGGTEDLHGDDLGIGSHAGDTHQLGSIGEEAAPDGIEQCSHVLLIQTAVGVQVGGIQVLGPGAQDDVIHQDLGIGGIHHAVGVQIAELVHGNVAVGGGDTGHVGAMGAHVIQIVADVGVAVHIVEIEGHLGVDIQLLGGQLGEPLAHVQLGQDLRDGRNVHQVQGLNILVQLHSGLGGILGQGILEALGGEGLVVGVRAGVHHGNGRARTVVAIGVLGHVGTGHLLGHDVVGLGLLGVVDRLQIDPLHALDLGDSLNVAVADVGGDGVGHQGQIPDHIQLLALQGLPGNGVGHLLLLGLELGAVIHRIDVGGEALAALELVHGRSALQDDHDTDHVRIGIQLLVLVFNDRAAAKQLGADTLQLFIADGGGGSLNAVHAQAQDHDHGKHQSQGPSHHVMLHAFVPPLLLKKEPVEHHCHLGPVAGGGGSQHAVHAVDDPAVHSPGEGSLGPLGQTGSVGELLQRCIGIGHRHIDALGHRVAVQEGDHLGPVDRLGGGKQILGDALGDALLHGPGHVAGAEAVGGHVGKARLGLDLSHAGQSAQQGDEGSPVHVQSGTEVGLGDALDVALGGHVVHGLVEPLTGSDILEPVAAAHGGEGHGLVHGLSAELLCGDGDVRLIPPAGGLEVEIDQLFGLIPVSGAGVCQTDGQLLVLCLDGVDGEGSLAAHIGQVIGIESHGQPGIGSGLQRSDHHRHSAVVSDHGTCLDAGVFRCRRVHAEHRQHQHHAKKQGCEFLHVFTSLEDFSEQFSGNRSTRLL